MYNKNFSKEPTEKQKIGQIGEDRACEYLEKNGYGVIERNYLKKWGEIDIVAKKASKIHFIEVKSVSRNLEDVTHVTKDTYNPEDNMHPWKLERLGRAVQSYLLDRNVPDEVEWQFDLVTVYIDMNKRLSRVEIMEDLVL
ncbi:MAG: putative endonuclease [Parcubacteria bacterium C7867-003]|nr:MAG: putative endonuclease [Parcubacteria bacterium C7867-003]